MFITFEGIEGSGKSTQIRSVHQELANRGTDCISTREPGGTRIGKKIREILLDASNTELDYRSELLLYIADRIQHVATVIQPALDSNRIVLCDRFMDATIIYQGVARGIGQDLIRNIHELLLGAVYPDLTFLFDLDPLTGLQRARKDIETGERSHRETRFEDESIRFHEKIRTGYLDLARSEPDRFCVLDAAAAPESLTKQILNTINGKLTQ